VFFLAWLLFRSAVSHVLRHVGFSSPHASQSSKHCEHVTRWVRDMRTMPTIVVLILFANVKQVTGYDFPDLVKEDGAALFYDLGIKRRSFRKRIIKAIEIRLLGLGEEPPPLVAEVVYLGAGAAKISWIEAPGTKSPPSSLPPSPLPSLGTGTDGGGGNGGSTSHNNNDNNRDDHHHHHHCHAGEREGDNDGGGIGGTVSHVCEPAIPSSVSGEGQQGERAGSRGGCSSTPKEDSGGTPSDLCDAQSLSDSTQGSPSHGAQSLSDSTQGSPSHGAQSLSDSTQGSP
ncbi:unnamed protein product, partial [Discosporangium mesarthrocarpum]